MNFQSLVVAFTFAVAALTSPTSVLGADCTTAQLAKFKAYPLLRTNVDAACPTFDTPGPNAIHLTKPESFTVESLAAMAPCKAETCRTELAVFLARTPDCELYGLNMKAPLQVTLQLCEAFNAGNVTVDDALALVADVGEKTRAAMNALQAAAAEAGNNDSDNRRH